MMLLAKICFFAAFYQWYSLFSLEWLQNKSAASFPWQLFRHAWALISLLFSWQNTPLSWYILCNTTFSLSPAWTLGHVCMPQLKKIYHWTYLTSQGPSSGVFKMQSGPLNCQSRGLSSLGRNFRHLFPAMRVIMNQATLIHSYPMTYLIRLF